MLGKGRGTRKESPLSPEAVYNQPAEEIVDRMVAGFKESHKHQGCVQTWVPREGEEGEGETTSRILGSLECQEITFPVNY